MDVIRRLVNHILIDLSFRPRLVNRFWSTPHRECRALLLRPPYFQYGSGQNPRFSPRLMYQFMRKSRVKALTARPSKRMALSFQ